MVSELHQRLENAVVQGIDGKIDLFGKLAKIKAKAWEWLCHHKKNGFEHSERLEEYLVKLTQKPRQNGHISTGEIFVLLCAAYLHDIGYWHNGKLDPIDHPQRSHDRIINDPGEYLLGGFPLFGNGENRVAKAIALVCLGHSEEKYVPLSDIPKEFADQNLCPDQAMNLRLLAALLRLADETDDPYVRIVDNKYHALRSNTPLVVVGDETIAWYWRNSGTTDPEPFLKNLEEKKKILVTAIDYLREIQCGNWYLVLHPQVPGSAPFMAEKPTETFVGREDDLVKIHAIVQKRRTGAVTGVVGTGGIGKTELARMYAERFQNEYPGGIFWASLKGNSWKNEASKILAELRPGADTMAFPDDGQAKDAVIDALDRRHALLVIDNVYKADEIIKPSCRVLVATRNRDAFGTIPHDAVHRLDKMDTVTGLELLALVLGSDRVSQDQAGAEQLVKTLGGMPLALEIAARHLADIPDYTFHEYIDQVKDRIDLIALDSEEKNVLASLELSLNGLELLEHGTKLLALFYASAVCAAPGFTSDTLIATAGLTNIDRLSAKSLVGKLHQHSLFEFHKETNRFSLHTMVRQMAESRLKADEGVWKKFIQNHCDYFVRYASDHRDDPSVILEEKDGLWQAVVQTSKVQGLEDRAPKLFEAMTELFWDAIANNDFESGFKYLSMANLVNMDQLGKYKDLMELFDPLEKNRKMLRESSQGWILNSTGLAYVAVGQYHTAINHFKQALEISRRLGDIRGESATLDNLGVAYANLGLYRTAIEHYRLALETSDRIGDMHRNGNALCNMGVAYANLGQYRTAIECYKQALDISRRTGDMRGEGKVIGNIGNAYSDIGQYQIAIDYYYQQLEAARQIGDIRSEGNALGNMGSAYGKLGQYETAIGYHEQALEISRRIEDIKGEGSDLGNLGNWHAKLGHYIEALSFYEERQKLAKKIGDVRAEANTLGNMGVVFSKLGDKARSRGCFEDSISIFRKLGLKHMLEQVFGMMRRVGIE